jgi:hypothetical protein
MATGTKKAAAPKVEIPPEAKQPEDHKPKAATESASRKVTVRDHEWVILEEALDDFELLDDLNALDQHDDPTRMPAVLRKLLGDQWKVAMDLLRDKESGRVSIKTGTEFVFELMTELNPNS